MLMSSPHLSQGLATACSALSPALKEFKGAWATWRRSAENGRLAAGETRVAHGAKWLELGEQATRRNYNSRKILLKCMQLPLGSHSNEECYIVLGA